MPARMGIVAILSLAAAVATGQGHVDFSGEWVLVSAAGAPADTPRTLTVRQSVTNTTARGEPMQPYFSAITIDEAFENGTIHTRTHALGVLGGVVGGIGEDGRHSNVGRSSSATWDGNELTFESSTHGITSPNDWTRLREVWTLDADGRLHIETSTTTADGRNSSTAVYRRR